MDWTLARDTFVGAENVRKEQEAKAEKNKFTPMEEYALFNYLDANPKEAEKMAHIPGLEGTVRNWTKYLVSTGGPRFEPSGGDNSMYVGGTKAMRPTGETPQVTAPGTNVRGVQLTPKITKQTIINKVAEKAFTQGIDSLAPNEKTLLGINDKKTSGELKPIELMRVRALAKDMAKTKLQTDMPTEEEINYELGNAKKFLYPNLQDSVNVDISLPKQKMKASQAVEYLISNYGMNESEAKNWVRTNSQRTTTQVGPE